MIKKIIQLIFTFTGILIIYYTFYRSMSTTEKTFDSKFIDLESFSLIFYSLAGLLLTCFRFQKIIFLIRHLIFSSQIKLENQYSKIRSTLKEISEVYYQSGPSALLKYSNSKEFSEIWREIFEQLEAKVNIEDIIEYVRFSQENTEIFYEEEINILRNLSQMAPSLGLLGTVIGLIKLLAGLKDFDTIGPNMSLALLTTLYGLFTSIMIINPLINRLEDVKNTNLKFYDLAAFWLTMLQKGSSSIFTDSKKIK